MVQFEDLNPESNAFQRTFVKEVRRCDEMERKLRYLSLQVFFSLFFFLSGHLTPFPQKKTG